MTIYKRCSRCHKQLLVGSKCPCTKIVYKEYKKYRTDKEFQKFYTTKEWICIKESIISKLKGLDIYTYYILGETEYGYLVHHIDPIKDNWDKRLDINNLIYLTESNHKLIHKMMIKDKQGTMKLLLSLIDRFKDEFGVLW